MMAPMEKLVVALPKGRLLKDCVALFGAAGFDFSETLGASRKLIFPTPDGRAEALVIRAQDVPTYVEQGAADVGIVGSDVLAEQGKDLYEPLDLGFGTCRMVVAEPRELSERDNPDEWTHIKIASKYPKLTQEHFDRRGVQIEILKLYGSIELAPLVGLSERIVDLVSTGETLRQNGLVEVETIMTATTRLVVNRASLKTRREFFNKLIDDISAALPS